MMLGENRWVVLVASALLLLATCGLSQPESGIDDTDSEMFHRDQEQSANFLPQPPVYFYHPLENFIDYPSKRVSEFLGGPGKRTLLLPPQSELRRYQDKRLSEFLGGPGKRLSEFLGGPGKRLSEFLVGPGKRLSEFLGGPGKRLNGKVYFMKYDGPAVKRLSEVLRIIGRRNYNSPDGSEFLGGPGKK